MNFKQHVDVLDADGPFLSDGSFLPDGPFVPLPAVPEVLLREGFRQGVLDYFARAHARLAAQRDLLAVEMKENR
jgi:hypothetical protein